MKVKLERYHLSRFPGTDSYNIRIIIILKSVCEMISHYTATSIFECLGQHFARLLPSILTRKTRHSISVKLIDMTRIQGL